MMKTRVQEAKPIANLLSQLLAGDAKLQARLAKAGLLTMSQMALLESAAIKASLGELTAKEASSLTLLRTQARRLQTRVADQAVVQMLARSAGGNWLGGKLLTPRDPKRPELKLPCHCGCCDSIFSLKAYLFDLLDLLLHYWRIDLRAVERLLLRSFDKVTAYDARKFRSLMVDLDCTALNAPLPQARIASEVLEVHLQALGKSVAAAWPKLFVDGLLRLILPQQVAAAMIAGEAKLATRSALFTIVKVEGAPDLPVDFATAISQWKAELSTLVPDLTGIDRATVLLADNATGMIGYEPDAKFGERRDATVRQWLIDYRDALWAASGIPKETLEASLFISLDSGTCRTTTRLQELVTSVQQIVESIRSGEILRLYRPDLPAGVTTLLRAAEALPPAESAWERLRDFETWLGYMYGWVYPENVLSPLAENTLASASFQEISRLMQAEPLTADAARKFYLDAVAPASTFQAPESLALEKLALEMANLIVGGR